VDLVTHFARLNVRMPSSFRATLVLLAVFFLFLRPAAAQESTSPATAAELEAVYFVAIENRTADILKQLALDDPAKVTRIHDAIIAQYRALKARDEAIDNELKAKGKDAAAAAQERAALLSSKSKPLHEQFVAKLSADLTPDQVETVKNKMTYNKVKVTYDAYCVIIPDLTEKDKTKILEMLKEAREEAMDGGSATEKSAIFQKYKDKINDYLNANGHDVAKAYKDWDARQQAVNKTNEATPVKVSQTPQ